MGTRNMTEDILNTIVCIAEGVLSERSHISGLDVIDSYEAITLFFFLNGSSAYVLFRIHSKMSEGHRKNLKAAQINADQIWRSFYNEFIPMHFIRNKWLKDQKHNSKKMTLYGL